MMMRTTAVLMLALSLAHPGIGAAMPIPSPDPDPSTAEAEPASVLVRKENPWAVAETPPVLTAAIPHTTVPDPDPDELPEYSDAYFVRYEIHRYASYAMLPLFAAQALSGMQLMDKGSDAPGWARSSHGPLAAAVAGLFAVNTVTGGWNLWESRKDPVDRGRRTLHSLLMLAADAGFAATGMLAEDAEENGDSRALHRNVALGSIGTAALSYAIMLPIFGN